MGLSMISYVMRLGEGRQQAPERRFTTDTQGRDCRFDDILDNLVIKSTFLQVEAWCILTVQTSTRSRSSRLQLEGGGGRPPFPG